MAEPMSSDEQISQSVKNTKTVIENGESDESTTLDIDIQFKTPLTKVGRLTNPTAKVQIGIGLTKTLLHPTACLVDSGERPNFINEDYLKTQ